MMHALGVDLSITVLDFDDAAQCAAWDALVVAHPAHLAFYTVAWGRALERLLPRCRTIYLMAKRGDTLCGVLPAVLQRDGPYGAVVNALGYFGSHGAPLVTEGPHESDVREALLDAFDAIADRHDAASATVIANPLDPRTSTALVARYGAAVDMRIGQLNALPQIGGTFDEVSSALLPTYHPKTRLVVRNALAGRVRVRRDDSMAAMEQLAAVHAQNMTRVGGRTKPTADFAVLRDCFAPGTGSALWVAEHDAVPIAYLLCLYAGQVVEYFTPATVEGFRSQQPMSLLIHHAMCDAVQQRRLWWNWGGTWATQDGVYRFKKRWGALDVRYGYYARIRHESLRHARRNELLDGYPNLYVTPFDGLHE